MTFDPQGLRKAAILVGSLPTAAADRLLDCFAPDQAQRVRQAMVDMDDVDPREEQRILEEFFRAEPARGAAPGIALNERLRQRYMADAYVPSSDARPTSQRRDQPFRFLQDAEAEKLARVLAGERPQTIALVLSHLAPDQAGPVLVRLEPGLQADVIRRLVDLEETDPAILAEVEQALESRLSQQVRMQRRRVAGLTAVAGILDSSARGVSAKILQNLASRDQSLAERFAPPPVEFDDLVRADDRTWTALFQAADPDVVLLALVGAAPALIERILRRIPTAEAEVLRRKLDHPGPVRLRDVEDARQELAELARQLAVEGRIDLPYEARTAMRVAA